MKVVFVGPSLPDAETFARDDLIVRPPACQGDVMKALEDGATAIGLIDGQFEFVAPVWHKELLFALSEGKAVYGAASMGALRAAECAAYGMIGIGKIFDAYISGQRIDDADVALVHSPAELGYFAMTVPLVNVDATLAKALAIGLLSDEEEARLSKAARALFFKDRTWKKVVATAELEWARVDPIIKAAQVDQKRLDAIALMDEMRAGNCLNQPQQEWQFNATPLWRKLYS